MIGIGIDTGGTCTDAGCIRHAESQGALVGQDAYNQRGI